MRDSKLFVTFYLVLDLKRKYLKIHSGNVAKYPHAIDFLFLNNYNIFNKTIYGE